MWMITVDYWFIYLLTFFTFLASFLGLQLTFFPWSAPCFYFSLFFPFCLYLSTIKNKQGKKIIKGELEHRVFFWATRCFLWAFLWCIAIIFFRREASPCTHKSFPCENISVIKWKPLENNRMVWELKVWLQFWVPFYPTGLLLGQHFSKIQKE